MKEQILALRDSGLTYRQIAKELNCSLGTIGKYINTKRDIKHKLFKSERGPKVIKEPSIPKIPRSYYHAEEFVKLRAKERMINSRYKISWEEYLAIYESQNHICPICKSKITLESSHIDHDHNTGKVRGILCVSCNIGIGQLKDSIEVLKSAISYLSE